MLFANGGNDSVPGDRGDDIIIGGDDIFVYGAGTSGSIGLETNGDFRSGDDALLVSDDLTMLFEEDSGLTRLTLTDDAGELVGSVDILGNSFDVETDVTVYSGTEVPGGDLFS